MVCSNCGSESEMESKHTDGQGYYEEEDYICQNCGEEWTWEMTKKITKHGKNMDEDSDEEIHKDRSVKKKSKR